MFITLLSKHDSLQIVYLISNQIMACEGCTLTLSQSIIKFSSISNCVEYLQLHGVLPLVVNCNTCGQPATMSKDYTSWRCQKTTKVKLGHKLKISKCAFYQSIKTDTWLSNSNLTVIQICNFCVHYLLLNPPHQKFIAKEMTLTPHTVVDWSSFIREVLVYWCVQNSSELLGGPGTVVEVDETKFGRRKYHKGRLITGQWVFGGIQRDNKHLFMETVADRSKQTLLSIIKRRIAPGTTIISDCWKSYNCLQDEGTNNIIKTINSRINHHPSFRFCTLDCESFLEFCGSQYRCSYTECRETLERCQILNTSLWTSRSTHEGVFCRIFI